MSKYRLVLRDKGLFLYYTAVTYTEDGDIDEENTETFDEEKYAIQYAKKWNCDEVVRGAYNEDNNTYAKEVVIWKNPNRR